MSANPRKLCIVSPYCYPLFNPERCQGHFGGWEVRVSLIAQELASRGSFNVSMVVWDHGQSHVEVRDGVTLYAWTGRPDPSIPPVLRRHVPAEASTEFVAQSVGTQRVGPRPTAPYIEKRFKQRLPGRSWAMLKTFYIATRQAIGSLYAGMRGAATAYRDCLGKCWGLAFQCFGMIRDYAVMRDNIAIYDEIDADIYLVPGNHNRAAEVAYYCRRKGKKYVFLTGSDIDYNPTYKSDPEKLDTYGVPGYLMQYAIENATLHIVQSQSQADSLKRGYGRSSLIIRNPLDTRHAFARASDPSYVLWVGSADDRVRRPSLVLELARRMPEYSFVMVMVPAVHETYAQCITAAKSLPNVTLVGRTPFREIERHYAQARLFVNTSLFEGFPNTFLQAAKYGVPIVALRVDPGEMLTRNGCGITCRDSLDDMEQAIRALLCDDARYASMSANCIRYVAEYHDKEKVIPRFEEALLGLF